MEITPASLPQIQKGRRGRVVFVDHDAFDIAKRLREIDTSLRLAWNEFGEYFVVYQILRGPNDSEIEHLVTTWDPKTNGAPDGRLVERVMKIAHPEYDFAAELDRIDREADKKNDYEFAQKVGPYAERLYHAMRKEMGIKDSIIVPDVFPRGAK
jgi:hypothetical protein